MFMKDLYYPLFIVSSLEMANTGTLQTPALFLLGGFRVNMSIGQDTLPVFP